MTRVLTEGFEGGSLPGSFTTTTGASIAISSTQVNTGTKSVRINPTAATSYLEKTVYGGGGGEFAVFARFYMYIATAPSASMDLVVPTDGAGVIGTLRLETNRTLRMYLSGVAQGTASAALNLNQWYCIEYYYDDRNSGGTYGNNAQWFRVDGATVGSVNTGVDFVGWDRIRIGAATAVTCDIYIDDCAVNDQNGTTDKDWIGTLGPTPDAGTYAQWAQRPPGWLSPASQPFSVVDPDGVASGTTWTPTVPDDPAGLTDTAQIDQLKTVSDDAGVTDPVALAQSKAITDDAGESDSFALTQSKVVADDAGLTGSQAIDQLKATTDTTGLTDTVSIAQTKGVTDDGGLSDTSVVARIITQDDPENLADTTAIDQLKTVTDDSGLTGNQAFDQLKTVTDTTGLTDTTALTQAKTVTDDAGLSDSALVVKIIIATDDAGVADTSAIDQLKAVTDPGGLTDTTATLQSKVVTDTTGLVDTFAITQSKVVTDTTGLTDSSSVQKTSSNSNIERGISVSGAEFTPSSITATQLFSNVNVGTYDSDYRYEGVPTTISSANHLTFSYLFSRGFRTVKIPIRWERIQRTLGGALDSTEVSRLTKELDMANTAGLKVVLDIHNYGLYYLDGSQTTPTQTTNTGYQFPIGGTVVTQAHFADLWSRMATAFGSHAAIKGYHIMNEPQPTGGLTRSVWYSCAQAAVTAIRAVDTNAIIRVGGWQWSDIRAWTTNNPSGPWITDTVSGKLWYEGHHYWDQDASGGYTTYADALAQAVTDGYTAGANPDALYTKILTQLQDFQDWCTTNGVTGVIGEFSWPGNSTTSEDNAFNALAHAYMTKCDQQGIHFDAWSTGEFYGNPPDPLLFYYASGVVTTGVDTQRASAPELEEHLFPSSNLGGSYADPTGLTDSFSITLTKVVTDTTGLASTSAVSSTGRVDENMGLTDPVGFVWGKVLVDSNGVTDSALVEYFPGGILVNHPHPGSVIDVTLAGGGVAVLIAGGDDATPDQGSGFANQPSGGGIISSTGGGGLA
jgi:hypothetical protein